MVIKGVSNVSATKPWVRSLGVPKAQYRYRCVVRAQVATVAPSINTLTDQQRAQLAKETGFHNIGKELPEDVSLNDVIKSLPKEVFELDNFKALKSVLITIGAVSLGVAATAVCPWYLLPLVWFWQGTAATGMFVIGHDCGHRSFHNNNLVEDIVGNIIMSPLIYPFEPWRILHNQHHVHTNKLEKDTAWLPMNWNMLDNMNTVQANLFKIFLGTPLKLFASIGHWLVLHFRLDKFNEKQRPAVIVSWLCNFAFAFIGLPLLVKYTGIWGLVKFWLMPWIGYHFWMSTFTVVHHTAPHIRFKDPAEWHAGQAQLSGTVHCVYPKWVEVLCHDINVHVPHHVSSQIPSYNLRKAYDSLLQNWGEYMTDCTWNWTMMKWIFAHCHVHDEEQIYVPFDHRKEEFVFALQRKLLGMEQKSLGF
eukprot:TRINITY_DN1912_c0_g1_i1.p2 TRINITY_DN1912_c0_g1~~TRINITY_DN1912_c0_g1_i1.p2  ORF type:complete len:419 (+),score=21.99 TRINITY_DN1912_c0_g1_i1:91-1347(+)